MTPNEAWKQYLLAEGFTEEQADEIIEKYEQERKVADACS